MGDVNVYHFSLLSLYRRKGWSAIIPSALTSQMPALHKQKPPERFLMIRPEGCIVLCSMFYVLALPYSIFVKSLAPCLHSGQMKSSGRSSPS